MTFDDILRAAQHAGPKRLAIAGKPNDALREALAEAREMGMAEATVYDGPDEAVAAIRSGDAEMLMKGSVLTRLFMKAVLNQNTGLREPGQLVSHVAVHEVHGRMLLVSDAGVVPHPTLEQKAGILRNALPVARALGIKRPKVAALASSEVVDERIPESVEARALQEMDFGECDVQGPLAIDLAVVPEAARIKGIDGPVAGQADLVIVPFMAVGNALSKSLMFLCNFRSGGVLAGLSHPVALMSRADTHQNRLDTLALGALIAHAMRHPEAPAPGRPAAL